MAHMCPTRGCKVTVPNHLLMCRPHWFELPRKDRDSVMFSYRMFGSGPRHVQEIQPILDRQAIRINRGE